MKAKQLFLSSCLAGLLLMFVYRADNGGILQSQLRDNHVMGEKGLDFVKKEKKIRTFVSDIESQKTRLRELSALFS